MRKFLLKSLFSCALALCASASSASEVDTLFFKPGDTGNCLLKVDTDKFPYLEGKEVTWIAGFPETEGTFNSSDTRKVCGIKISPEMIVTIDGKQYLHKEKIEDKWFGSELFYGAKDTRTLTLFYSHQIVSTKSVSENSKVYFTKEELENTICDTIAVLHISKALEKNNIEFKFIDKKDIYIELEILLV